MGTVKEKLNCVELPYCVNIRENTKFAAANS